MSPDMATSHTDASLASQITSLTTEVTDILGYFKKLEEDLAVIKNVNAKLIKRVEQTEGQCWANAQTHAKRLLKS